MESKRAVLTTGIISMVLLTLLWAAPGWGFELRWGTAPAGGLWPTLGAAMMEKVKEVNPDITGTALPGVGGHNFLGIKSGRFNIAFATTDASSFAWEGKEVYAGKSYRGFREVACFFPHVSQYLVWADSGIKTIDDLAGKRVTYGARGSGSEMNVRKMLELYGILDKVRFEYLSFSDAANRMKDRLLDAFLLNAPFPFPIFMDLSNTRPVRLLPLAKDKIEASLRWNPGLEEYALPGGIYKGVSQPTEGTAYRMHLIVSKDVPDDVVYKITKTLAENLNYFAKVAKPMAGITTKDMARKLVVPFHPGAEKYYKEIGVY